MSPRTDQHPFSIPLVILEQTLLAIQGNTAMLGAVFEFYRPRLLAHALRICSNSPLARDAVQDTFITVYSKIASLRNAQLVYPWMKRILVNQCFLLLRRERYVGLGEHQFSEQSLLQDSIESKLDSAADRQKLFDSLSRLSEEVRSCMILRYFSDFGNYETIATVLGIPVGTVRSRLAAGREQLTAFFKSTVDGREQPIREANEWSQYYMHLYGKMYDDASARDELISHHHPGLNLRYTSGSTGTGRKLLVKELHNDLHFGSRFNPEHITSCGNVSVIEGRNENHPDYPDRCAPLTAMVVFRAETHIRELHIFDSAR